MVKKIRTRTIESEGFSPEDWVDLIEPFEEHRSLTPHWPESLSTIDYLQHKENQTGGNPVFVYGDGFAHIYLNYSPYLRSEEGIMINGEIRLNKGIPYSAIEPISLLNYPGASVSGSSLGDQHCVGGLYMTEESADRSKMVRIVKHICRSLSEIRRSIRIEPDREHQDALE